MQILFGRRNPFGWDVGELPTVVIDKDRGLRIRTPGVPESGQKEKNEYTEYLPGFTCQICLAKVSKVMVQGKTFKQITYKRIEIKLLNVCLDQGGLIKSSLSVDYLPSQISNR
jgi:hypothetical protein